MTRNARAILAALLLMVVATACSFSVGGSSVDAADVEEQAQQQLASQIAVDSVDCPEDLPAEVGASITCDLVSEGETLPMTVTVTSVEGEQVNFDIEVGGETGATEAAS